MFSSELASELQNYRSVSKPSSAKIEHEIRFGTYDGRQQFNENCFDPVLFQNLKRHLHLLKKRHPQEIVVTKKQYYVTYYPNRLRKITPINSDLNSTPYYEYKYYQKTIDNPAWGLRYARSLEVPTAQPVDIGNSLSSKYIERTSYCDNRPTSQFYGFSIDCSCIWSQKPNTEDNLNVPEEPILSIELESISEDLPKPERWHAALKTIYGWTLDAKTADQIVSVFERKKTSRTISFYLTQHPQIEALDFEMINRPNTVMNCMDMVGKAISLKYDGQHKLLLFNSTGIWTASPPYNCIRISNQSFENVSIFEAEWVESINKYFIFDVLIYNEEDVRSCPLTERVDIRDQFCVKLNNSLFASKPIYYPGMLSEIFEIYQSGDFSSLGVSIDGLIFQSMNDYRQRIFKWKPVSSLTIDLKVTPDRNVYLLSKNKYELVQLNVNTNNCDRFAETQELMNSSGLIYEFQWNTDVLAWVPIRVRLDKSKPNAKPTINGILKMIQNPISFEQIRATFS